jgi:peptidoglycan/xylan/chitin deacetylase (PgdA/CDA1 family)
MVTRFRAGAVALAAVLLGAAPAAAQVDTGPTVEDPAVATAGPALDLALSSPVFSPNGDGRLDRVTLHVTVEEPVVLTVRLSRPGGVGTRLLADHTSVGAGTTNLVWSGRLHRPDGSWARAADGHLDVDVDAVDLLDEAAHADAGVVVDTRAPVVQLREVGPEPWSGQGLLTQRFATGDASLPLTMWAQVLDGDRVVDEMVHRQRAPDLRSLAWVPQAGSRTLTPGPYHDVVVVRDAAGNTGRSEAVPFRVHRPGSTRVIHDIEGAGRRVGLTIDDCTDQSAWGSMLDTLDRMDAGATFFCNGDYVRRYPGLARRTAALDRVSSGSHSTDHADLTTLGYDQVLGRLLGDENAWWDTARSTPAPFFRPPYGEYDSTVLAAAGAASLPFTVLWSIDTRDWDAPDAGTIVHRATDKAVSGSIVLIHVKDRTAEALPSIINRLRDRGLEPVGLTELIGH